MKIIIFIGPKITNTEIHFGSLFVIVYQESCDILNLKDIMREENESTFFLDTLTRTRLCGISN